jgi:hypothetical protein
MLAVGCWYDLFLVTVLFCYTADCTGLVIYLLALAVIWLLPARLFVGLRFSPLFDLAVDWLLLSLADLALFRWLRLFCSLAVGCCVVSVGVAILLAVAVGDSRYWPCYLLLLLLLCWLLAVGLLLYVVCSLIYFVILLAVGWVER